MKRTAIGHSKLKLLQRRLGEPMRGAAGLLELLWHFTAREAPRGDIGRLTDESIAIGVEWEGEAEALVEVLVACGWIDRHPEHRLVIHDWHDHAEDAVHMSLARRGLRFATGEAPRTSRLARSHRQDAPPEPEFVPAPDPEPECAHRVCAQSVRTKPWPKPKPEPWPKPEPEPSHSPETRLSPPTPAEPAGAGGERALRVPVGWEAHWEAFQAAYPERSGSLNRARGREVFKRLLAGGVPPDVILAGVRRYRAWADATEHTGTRFVQQITSWLAGEQWHEPWEASARGSPRKKGHAPSLAEKRDRVLAELAQMPPLEVPRR